MTEETTYYSDGKVHISNARAVIGGKTYAMANITSVSASTKTPNRLWPLFFGGVGALFVLVGIVLLITRDSMGGSTLGCGAVGLVIGVLMWVSTKTQYLVVIGSASGEVQALRSQDEKYVRKVVAALNKAIVERG